MTNWNGHYCSYSSCTRNGMLYDMARHANSKHYIYSFIDFQCLLSDLPFDNEMYVHTVGIPLMNNWLIFSWWFNTKDDLEGRNKTTKHKRSSKQDKKKPTCTLTKQKYNRKHHLSSPKKAPIHQLPTRTYCQAFLYQVYGIVSASAGPTVPTQFSRLSTSS